MDSPYQDGLTLAEWLSVRWMWRTSLKLVNIITTSLGPWMKNIGWVLGGLPSGHAELVIRNVRVRRVLLHGAGAARRWDEYAVIGVPPDIWIGREIGRCALGQRRKAAGQTNRADENACREVLSMSGHRVLLCDTASGAISKFESYAASFRGAAK